MLSAIYIMWLRQIKQYWRSKARMFGSLGQPLMFLLALGYGFGPIYEAAGGGNYLQFLTPGIIGMTILFGAVFNGMSLIWDKQFGFLKETLVAPVPRWTILIGRCLGGATVNTIQATLVLLISIALGFRLENYFLIIPAILFMYLVAILFTLLGTIIASKLDDMHAFQIIVNFLIMPIFFLSGALFDINNLPSAVTSITKINPLTYGVDGLRYVLSGASQFSFTLDLSILVLAAFILLAIGTYFFNKIEV